MEESVYQNTIVQRGTKYVIMIVKREAGYFITLTSETGEKIRDARVPEDGVSDSENFSAAVVFREIVEAEERWVADNR